MIVATRRRWPTSCSPRYGVPLLARVAACAIPRSLLLRRQLHPWCGVLVLAAPDRSCARGIQLRRGLAVTLSDRHRLTDDVGRSAAVQTPMSLDDITAKSATSRAADQARCLILLDVEMSRCHDAE